MGVMIRFSAAAMMGCICFTIYSNVGKLMINYFVSVEEVRIYGVYYHAAFTVVTLASGIFTTILFPTISGIKDIRFIYKKMNTVMVYYILLDIPIVMIFEYLILKLYGAQVPMVPALMLLFALTAMLWSGYDIYQWLFNAEGISGAHLALTNEVINTVLNLVLNFLLIPRYGLYGAIGATTIVFSIVSMMARFRGRRLQQSIAVTPSSDLES